MTLRFLLQHRLAFLVLSVVSLSPGFVSADDIYNRDDQTDADYDAERIEELIGLVKSVKDWDRSSVFWDLQALGPEARPAIPNLIAQLHDQSIAGLNVRVNDYSSRTLSFLKADAVASLVKAFPSASAEVKRMIAQCASNLGEDARELLPLLRKEYDPEDEDSRITYLIAIASIDPTGETALPLLVQTLQMGQDEWVRQFAAQCLSRHKTRPEWPDVYSRAYRWMKLNPHQIEQVVNVLLQALKDEHSGVRAEVIRALTTYPEHEQMIVPEVLPSLADESRFTIVLIDVVGSERVSEVTMRALRHFSGSAENSVPALVNWALREDRSRVYQAEEVLAVLIPLTANPLEYAEQILNGNNPELAFLTLARLGVRSAPLIESLKVFADSEESHIALKAKLTLACIDERWQFPAFGLLEEEYASQRKANFKNESLAFSYLANVGDKAAFAYPVLRRYLQLIMQDSEIYSSTASLYGGLVQLLGNTGRTEPGDIPVILAAEYIIDVEDVEASLFKMCPQAEQGLIAHLREPECPSQHRILCLRVLAAAHADNPELVPLIIAQLKSKYPPVRESAVQALGEIGTKTNDSVMALAKALSDPRVRVRAKALDSLSKFGDKAQPAVPHIIESLADDYLTVQVAAVRCLGDLGKTAAPAINDLEKLKGSQSLLLRETVGEALQGIQAAAGEMK